MGFPAETRQQWLENQGIHFLHSSIDEVLRDVDSVVAQVSA